MVEYPGIGVWQESQAQQGKKGSKEEGKL